MGMKFLNKKGWHTGSLRNIENVWKAEQKHEAEQKKLEELRKQILEEKERSEFRRLQEQAGLVPRQERLDFLYDSGLSVGKSSSDGGFKALEALPQPNNNEVAGSSSSGKQDSGAPGALFEDKPQSANDAWRKLHSDPLLMIRQREQEALARIKNNPVKMAMIRKSVESKKHEDDGRDKVKRKHRKHSSSKQRSDSEGDDARGKAKRSKKDSKRRGSKYRDDTDTEKEKEDVRSDKRRRDSEREDERSSRQYKDSERSDRQHRDSEREDEKSSRRHRDSEREDERSSRQPRDSEKEDERSSRRHRDFEKEDERSSRRHKDFEKEDERSSRRHKDFEKEDERSIRRHRDFEKEDERSSRQHRGSPREDKQKKYRERSPVESRPEKSDNRSPTKGHHGMSKNEKTQTEDNRTSVAVSGIHHRRRNAAPKLSAEERAARLREMQRDAELHEEQRWRRLKKADENDAKEAAQPVVSGGKTFLDAAQKTVYGAEQGGCTIEESVRRRSHYLQHRSAAEGNAFRR